MEVTQTLSKWLLYANLNGQKVKSKLDPDELNASI